MIKVKDVYAYIGQSINIDKRLKQHIRAIENKEHPNICNIGDISLKDCEFKVLAECSKEELNKHEIEEYDKYSTSYIMLNKKSCGQQAVNGETLQFYNNENPTLELKGDDIYINNIKIRKEGKMFCLTDLIYFIKNNSDYDFRPNRILIKNDFIDRINALYKINIPKDRSTPKYLKQHGLYKVLGARANKKVYCEFGVFITFAFFSCPQFAASICIMVGDNVFGL